jgi:hypothetical protein
MAGDAERRLILVVGVGRSGTSLLAGMLGQLGFHIPQPEVKADDTNPRGFGEPRWVVDFHHRLMRRRRVTVNDSRPEAWASTYAAGGEKAVRDELTAWLAGEFDGPRRVVVVKDPRTVWFLPLWAQCAEAVGAATVSVTMLRHPAEIIASAKRSYGDWQSDASRASAWINVILETERATRDSSRAFMRYDDLLAEWPEQIRRLGPLTGSELLAQADRERLPEVDRFVDPTLHRNRVRWDAHAVPERVRVLADGVWEALQPLASGDGDAATLSALDALHSEYLELYAEAEAIAQSSITAVKRRAPAAAKAPPAPPPLRVRLARRVPARYRRRLRGAVRSLRPRRSR